jgi:alanine dehydrogenase
MTVGVPREIERHEHRVGLNPFAVSRLVRGGHAVLVESRAGEAARFADSAYREAGAQIVYGGEEVYRRSDLVCRVGALSSAELELLKPRSVLCSFHHLIVARRETIDRLIGLEATLIGYEIIRDAHGDLPVLVPFSEMAGQMALHLAAHYLQTEAGGRGVLLGNVPGVPPPTVLILGAGHVGRAAARQALASGTHVIVLDDDLRKLRALDEAFAGRLVTAVASDGRLRQYSPIADVVIGAILIPGERAPFVFTEAMVRSMKTGSVIIDVSIDQGGCVETSRPTSLDAPTFVAHGVVHYCVPNMTANIPRTASRALVNAALPYIESLADRGLEGALRHDPGLAAGVYLYRGRVIHAHVGRSLGVDVVPLDSLMDESR